MSSNWQSLLTGLAVLGGVGIALVALAGGCETGGNEGDRCNPLVERDECDNGLHCKAATCTESYCCPINGTSTEPLCNAAGCPDTDAGADAESEASATDGGDSG